MPTRLVASRYGKQTVRLVAVDRGAERHELKDLTVDVAFSGDYESAHRDGDNRRVYPTDSMKNSVYALARRHGVGEIEELALALARHFVACEGAPESVEVRIAERRWSRIEAGGAGRPGHPHAFVAGGAGGDERRTARVEANAGAAGGERVESGIEELLVLKTTGSGFAGFPRDAYTTLAETDDRILATAIEARWSYGRRADWGACWSRARAVLLESFAEHDSRSVQHTLYAMGERLLEALPEVEQVRLRLPNRHHLRVDLEPLGLDNPGRIFVATAEPYGLIEGTLRRG
jgi:urate oxidase